MDSIIDSNELKVLDLHVRKIKMPEAQFPPLECVIGNSTLRVEYCDITTLNVDVIVSSDDINLSMFSGVSAALFKAGGDAVRREAQAQSPITLGNIAITTAGQLTAKRIFHAAVVDFMNWDLTTIDLIRSVTKKCLVVCNELGFESIAFPAFATGVARLPPEHCAVAMMLEIAAYLSNITDSKLVVIALYARNKLPGDIIPRFYSQLSEFIELTQSLESMTDTLESLEKVYRQLKLDEAASWN
jgi:O-acetyl-ADP-ribose deacetylase (regulator of RNase III)